MSSPKKNETTSLRVIGGRFRSQKITVPVQPGLRPTHDRVRETLFNWLQPMVWNSSCLDAFSGSGALAFEAVSRGSSQAVLVEQDAVQAKALQKNAENLKIENQVDVINSAWPNIKLTGKTFNLVFLDPPFNSGLIYPTWLQLIDSDVLADECWVYVEYGVDESIAIPEGFECYRSKKTKQVVYELYRRLGRVI